MRTGFLSKGLPRLHLKEKEDGKSCKSLCVFSTVKQSNRRLFFSSLFFSKSVPGFTVQVIPGSLYSRYIQTVVWMQSMMIISYDSALKSRGSVTFRYQWSLLVPVLLDWPRKGLYYLVLKCQRHFSCFIPFPIRWRWLLARVSFKCWVSFVPPSVASTHE